MRHGMKVVWKLVKSKHNLESVKCLRERDRERNDVEQEVERIVDEAEREEQRVESGVIGENGC